MFKVLRNFIGKHQGERKRLLRENAQRVVNRDHVMARLQPEAGQPAALGAPEADLQAFLLPAPDTTPPLPAGPETAPVDAAPVQETAPAPASPAVAAPEAPPARSKARTKPARPKKAPKPAATEAPPAQFGFITEIDLDLKAHASDPPPAELPRPAEPATLPPDFGDKLQQLREMMDFGDL